MKIPQKYQIFGDPVMIFSDDVERLSPHISGWVKLTRTLATTDVGELDLKRLVIIELMGARRPAILNRLLGRLTRIQNGTLKSRIAAL